MPRAKHRFKMYQRLVSEAPAVLEQARKAAQELGLPAGTASPPDKADKDAREQDVARLRPAEAIVDRIREVVKDTYGEDYDCCPASSPAWALRLAWHAAFAPGPGFSRSAVAYVNPRCIVPRQKNLPHPWAMNPLPPMYKYLLDQTADPAPLSRAQDGFDAVIVPLEGATYVNHGASYSPVSLLAAADPESSLDVLAATAEVHAPFLSGIFSQGPSTPGCGFGPRDEDGVHLLHKGLGELAAEYGLPHLTDEAFGIPFLGRITPEPCASATVYGHPAMGGPGLIIGTEDLVAPLLREARASPTSVELAEESGVDAFQADPASLTALLDLLTDLASDPERYRRAVDRLYEVVTSELADLDSGFKKALRVRKDACSLSVEVNYEDTWRDGLGLPIFSVRDSRDGTNLLEACIAAMGISSASALEASITLHLPGLGSGRFGPDEERTRLEVKGLARLLQVIGKRSGFLD